jgi:[ribosomal protein S18]-alanine N-acetyltransferase
VDFLIRPYRAADFDRLWQIDQACFPPGIAYSQMELSGFITRRNAITLVAELPASDHDRLRDSKTIVAFAVSHPYRKSGRILTLDVLPEARRSGLGSKLLLESEARLRQRGCTEVYLETAVDNDAALKLYHKLEYRILRTLPGYYPAHGLDAFLMGKEL